ncbi:SH3 domain-containing C40 family peptidase [Desulfohalovibrio reitneri]|uniref:SH3 domain-containing C40 family peptidase n=1 Tax=Desulfohalovibrio reitneri TaxID=1307759 RepID=UPI000692564B|nr:SH3 domain-containing C40 family peptidase [Desulfohalovibrio reitneri]
MRACALLPVLLASLLLSGCAPASAPAPAAPDTPPVADLAAMPQTPFAYLGGADKARPLLAPKERDGRAEEFVNRLFSPWERGEPKYSRETVAWGFASFPRKSAFRQDLRPVSGAWYQAMRERAGLDSYPNLGRAAVAVANADLRVLPSSEPVFRDPALAGEGFPFDYNQNSSVWAGTPLYVSHLSRDGGWALVECGYTFGWMEVGDLAWAGESFRLRYRAAPLAAVVRDRQPVRADGEFRFRARVGMVLPAEFADGEWRPLVPLATAGRRAVAWPGSASAGTFEPFPLPATRLSLARLMDEMLGQAYGWGGLYGGRDCSQAVMDLLAPLGMAMPRNSSKQAEAGRVVDLTGLSMEEKERIIRRRAAPWATLLAMPGHVMLYLGQWRGKAAAFHATWGVKTRGEGSAGRRIIGRAVITSLRPGDELDALRRPEGLLIERLTGLAFPFQRPDSAASAN